jgi:hypothetical protein
MTHYHRGITAAVVATAHDWVGCPGTTKEADLGGDRRTPQQGRRAETWGTGDVGHSQAGQRRAASAIAAGGGERKRGRGGEEGEAAVQAGR